ncbi:MAG: hypothetical protein ACYCQJ_13385 [Nitrososphaerales archaeon]
MRTEEITCPDGSRFQFTGHVQESDPEEYGVEINGVPETMTNSDVAYYLKASGFNESNVPTWLAPWLKADTWDDDS